MSTVAPHAPHAVFAALSDPNRVALLDKLGSAGPASATTLARGSSISRQGVLKHLLVLQDARLVDRRRDGQSVVFEAATEPLATTSQWLLAAAASWDRRLLDLKRRAESPEPQP